MRRSVGEARRPGRLGEDLTRLDQLAGRGHHREHDAGRGAPRRVADRDHLVAQQVAVLEAEPDARAGRGTGSPPRGIGRYGSGLSPPTSRVRRVIRRPAMASAIASYSPCCSSTSGAALRSRKRNSVRTRPAPSAPPRARPGRRPPSRGWRRRRTASRRGTRRAARRGRAGGRVARRISTARRRYSSSSSGAGSTCSSPRPPSRTTVVPSGMLSTSRPGRHDHRDVAGPGQDGGVRRRAALGEHALR